MKKNQHEKYELDNLPIRNELRDAIRTKNIAEIAAIELIQTLLRSQGVQDEYIESLIEGVMKEMKLLRKDIFKKMDEFEKRVDKLEKVA